MQSRMIGQVPTKRYWDAASIKIAHDMKRAGSPTSEIAKRLDRTTASVRDLLNRNNNFPHYAISLAEHEKGITAKSCRKCLIEKPLDAFAVSKTRKVERRWPYCKPCEIARLADRREKGLHLEKTRRHVAKYREKYPEKDAANKIFGAAIRSGRIVRPESCEVCGQTPPRNRLGRSAVQGHHDDYSKPLEVRWFCHPCHIQHHRSLKNG